MSTLLSGGGGPLLTTELLKLIVRLLKKLPKLALRFVLTALSPGAHFKRLALVTALQALASLVHYARKLWARGSSVAWQRLAKARNYDEYSVAAREVESDAPPAGDALSGPQESFFATLRERAANYARLQAEGDEYGLMFHLRSELMRQQLGNRGYAREGSKWLREHSTAREAIAHYQAHVCEALRYIASGAAPSSSAARQRLAFVNETRHSYGRTALLLSGGGAFGVKHIGVVMALHKESLMPRILSGTSAGSIVAAYCGTKTDEELQEMLFEDPTQHIVALLSSLPFFGVQRGASEASLDSLLRDGSLADLARRSRNSSANACAGAAAAGAATTAAASSASGAEVAALKPPVPAAGPEAAAAAAREAAARASSLLREAARPLKNVAQGKVMMDQAVLRDALRHLCGDLTFLEAFDRTGRVLNIVVTRSDGRAPPLLCNYLTTPQMVVYSASLASCSIPGVYDAVELMAKDRHGALVPYFKTGGHRWTDGGLQADLPKQRLTELFNVNQFIVSQVNPVAPLVVPAPAPPLVTETLLCLKHQLLGALSGLSQFASGHLIRPFGFRVADMFLQEYEGTVTIYPRWSVLELLSFLSNFTVSRVEAYILDGERATWPHLELIRSLTDIEYTLDAVAAELQCVVHGKLMRQHSRSSYGGSSAQLAEMGNSRPSRANSNADVVSLGGGGAGPMQGGRMPSYISLDAYSGRGRAKEQPADVASSTPRKMVGVASHASLFALGSSLDLAGGGDEPPASVGFSL